jgi:hypothetical protein
MNRKQLAKDRFFFLKNHTVFEIKMRSRKDAKNAKSRLHFAAFASLRDTNHNLSKSLNSEYFTASAFAR